MSTTPPTAAAFDPNAAATSDSGLFGLPYTEKQAQIVLIPVPWEATTSYGGGTSNGPAAILAASRQVDLFDIDVERPYEVGLFLREESDRIRALNEEAKELAQGIIAVGGQIEGDSKLERALARVNELGTELNRWVRDETRSVLKQGKIPALLGGDHSIPFGALQAIAEEHDGFGVLHFDAHSDTRVAFEGFEWSHASILYNVLQNIPQVKKLVQVGIRDFCEQEYEYCKGQGERVSVFYDEHLSRRKHDGESFASIAREIVSKLPQEVWVTFDIDGLDPRFCPHTGTPVPGGLEFREANAILRELVRSGRKIIGFDLNEVAPAPDSEESGDEWDANVGARLLYKLSGWTAASQGLAKVMA